MNTPSIAFPHGGIYVMRSKRIYLLAVCHQIGVNRVGPHKHNDWLSFELCVDKQPVIIDPGTYCYTGNMEMRRLFRSTAYHNTVVVDEMEQLDIHNSMFALIKPHGDIQVLTWESNDTYDLLAAEHTGYTRLKKPVVHWRRFRLDKLTHEVTLTDSFQGKGEHMVSFHFHLEVGLAARISAQNDLVISKNDAPLLRITGIPQDITPYIQAGWVSKAYNHKEPAEIISWKTHIDAAYSQSFQHKIVIDEALAFGSQGTSAE